MPGFWGDWKINDEGNLSWSGAEKFYWYVQWLYFLIAHFSEPAGYKLTGKVRYEGGDPYDRGVYPAGSKLLAELPLWVFETIHEEDRTELYRTLEEDIRRQRE